MKGPAPCRQSQPELCPLVCPEPSAVLGKVDDMNVDEFAVQKHGLGDHDF